MCRCRCRCHRFKNKVQDQISYEICIIFFIIISLFHMMNACIFIVYILEFYFRHHYEVYVLEIEKFEMWSGKI